MHVQRQHFRSFDKHSSSKSSLTSLLGPLISVRNLRLVLPRVRLSAGSVQAWLLRLLWHRFLIPVLFRCRTKRKSELVNLTLLSPGSKIVVLYPGEPDRFFERILGWSVCDGTCWVSSGGDSRFCLEDLGDVAGLFDVTGQSDCPRSVVNLEHVMDAPSDDDVRALVESARDDALMERGRRNLVVDRELSSFISWTGERLDLPARGLLSRVMRITSRSRTAFPPAEVSVEREAALPVSSQSAPPSVRITKMDGHSWVIDEPVRDKLGRAVVTENEVFC